MELASQVCDCYEEHITPPFCQCWELGYCTLNISEENILFLISVKKYQFLVMEGFNPAKNNWHFLLRMNLMWVFFYVINTTMVP